LDSFSSYKDLTLPGPLAKALDDMGFVTPTPVQAEAIPPALTGKDILGTAQTGTGKTAAFGVPLLTRLYDDAKKQALILAPTRELAAQIHKVLREMSRGMKLHGVLVVGGESFKRQVDEIRRNFDYIVATPGRLNDHLQEKTIKLAHIRILVLDEVDRMLDMGFLPQIKRILRHVPTRRQTLLFSATLPSEITSLAAALLFEPVRVAIGPVEQPIAQVTEKTIRTTQEGKNSLILKEIRSRLGRILIFTRTKSRAERLGKLIHDEGYNVVVLHGGRSQSQRKQALDRFQKGSHQIMVATDLAGRGIDVVDIEHVINFDVPQTREDYIHRLGRTGRAGKTGEAVTFLITGDLDGERVISGEKAPSRVVFRSRRGPIRRSLR
jgi:ATP-dependent RNA helicase RhlE